MSTKRRHQPFPQAVRRLVMSLSVASSTTYIVYRAVYTLRVDDPYTTAASLALFIAELYGILLMCLYFWQIWDTTPVPPKPPLSGRSVDVMVPTYNEDVPLLRGTLQSMAALDYPHTVYVLDDGNRPEVAALAEELGVHYIARDNNLYAKAGNINNALDQTSGEFVAIFDADHIVLRHFLTATIGHFEDESVAFVQTPHAFYNFDSYSSTFSPGAADYWEEGDLFHHCVQNGKA
ncbi:MAG: glycosyltransferase, partial [Fuerstiella sp.]